MLKKSFRAFSAISDRWQRVSWRTYQDLQEEGDYYTPEQNMREAVVYAHTLLQDFQVLLEAIAMRDLPKRADEILM